MKNTCRLLLVVLVVLLLSLCSCSLDNIVPTPDIPVESGEIHPAVNIFDFSEQQLKEHLQNGGYEEHVAVLAAQYDLFLDTPEQGKPFDTETEWKSGVEYIDMSAFTDEFQSEDDDDDSDENLISSVPEAYRKFIPSGVKVTYVNGSNLFFECGKEKLAEIRQKLLDGGYTEMSFLDEDGTWQFTGAITEDGNLKETVLVSFSDDTGYMTFTHVA